MACWNWIKYRWRTKWSRFWDLTPQQRILLIQSFWLSAAFDLAIKGVGLRKVLGFLQRISSDRRRDFSSHSHLPPQAIHSIQPLLTQPSQQHLPSAHQPLNSPETDPQLLEAYRLAQLVEIASHNPIYPVNCLPKSLTLCWLLRQRGIPAKLQIGVSIESKAFRAHAWVEYAGQIINDRPNINTDFSPFPNIESALLHLKHHNPSQP